MKRPSAESVNQAKSVLPEVCALTRALPVLWEFLTAVAWDDGKPRRPGTLLLFSELGVFKGLLKDRACQRECWASGESLSGLLAVLNEGLDGDSLSWKPTRPEQNGRK